MTYTINEQIIIPYKLIKGMKNQLTDLLDNNMDNNAIFTLVATNFPAIRTLIKANYIEISDESFDDLDIFEDIVPMAIEIIAKAKDSITKTSEKYILHEYNADFTEAIGVHTTETCRVPLGVVEDVASAILGIQETQHLDPKAIDAIMEDVESVILRSFPTLDCIRIESLDALEIVRVYRKYFELGITLLTKKNGITAKASKTAN